MDSIFFSRGIPSPDILRVQELTECAQAVLGRAEAAGWKPLDGLSMLVAQAAFSFEMWFGILPDMQGALARCRKQVEATS